MKRAIRRAFVVSCLAFWLGLLVVGHYYLWVRLIRDPSFPPVWSAVLTAVLVVLFFSVVIAFGLSRALRPEVGRTVLLPGMTWVGFLFLTVVLLIAVDVAWLSLQAASSQATAYMEAPQTRQLLVRVLAGLVVFVAAVLGGCAIASALRQPRREEIQVALERLPAKLDGLTIAQLSDMHVGCTLGAEFVEKVVERTNAMRPDLVVITGDLVDGKAEVLRDHLEPLSKLAPRYGVFFVPGNHEYDNDLRPWLKVLQELGIRVLRNERVSVGEADASLDLAGVDDYAGRTAGGGPDFDKALDGRDPSREVVLLAHQPRAIRDATRHGAGLVLSGHTHGGQVWPMQWLLGMGEPAVAGLRRFGKTWLYVSRGTGFWGPPMRLGAPAEITLITLRSAI